MPPLLLGLLLGPLLYAAARPLSRRFWVWAAHRRDTAVSAALDAPQPRDGWTDALPPVHRDWDHELRTLLRDVTD